MKIDIGHKSVCRTDKTEEGYTHDWVVFVRGTDGSSISHFVEKVVFHLHESFPKPKRGWAYSISWQCQMIVHDDILVVD